MYAGNASFCERVVLGKDSLTMPQLIPKELILHINHLHFNNLGLAHADQILLWIQSWAKFVLLHTHKLEKIQVQGFSYKKKYKINEYIKTVVFRISDIL